MRCIPIVVFLLSVTMLSGQSLQQLAHQKGKYIGTAVKNEFLEKQVTGLEKYSKILKTEFNVVVAENAFKMLYLLPEKPEDPFNFTIKDFDSLGLSRIESLLTFAKQNNIRVRGHAFIWYNQAPEWLKDEAKDWTSAQIFKFTECYIKVLGTYTKGRVHEWDVMNELINDDPNAGYRREGVWYKNVNDMPLFINHCFSVAKRVDPAMKTFYNDYNIEFYGQSKNVFMLNMVGQLKLAGVEIDGVGFQSHFVSGESITPSSIERIGSSMDRLRDLGLEVAITELDLRICGGVSEQKLEVQKEEFRLVTALFLSKENCHSMLFWGVSDKGSWIPYTFPDCGGALLFDDAMVKKPAYFGVLEGFK